MHGIFKGIRKVFAPKPKAPAVARSVKDTFGTNPLYESRNKGGTNPLYVPVGIQASTSTQPQVAKRSITVGRSPVSALAQPIQTVPPKARVGINEIVVCKSVYSRSNENQECSWPLNVKATVNLRVVD